MRIIGGIEQAAQENGFSVLLGDTQGAPEREHEYASMVLTNRADGLIQLDHSFPFSAADADLAAQIPMVSVCERIAGDKKFPVIQLDNYSASRALTHHILSFGHQQLAAIVGQTSSQIYHERLAGIRSVLEEEGIPFADSQITGGAYTIEAGIAGVEYLLRQPQRPTAIFCFNDDIAIGAIHALKKAGLRVPQDISVVGFDNIKVSAFIDPPLTTIDQPAYDMGRRAVEVLVSQIRGEPLLRNKEVLPYQLIERDSVAPVASR